MHHFASDNYAGIWPEALQALFNRCLTSDKKQAYKSVN